MRAIYDLTAEDAEIITKVISVNVKRSDNMTCVACHVDLNKIGVVYYDSYVLITLKMADIIDDEVMATRRPILAAGPATKMYFEMEYLRSYLSDKNNSPINDFRILSSIHRYQICLCQM